MKNETYGMFTPEGNYMVSRIVDAAKKLVEQDSDQLTAELRKLGYADAFGEATDTDVREQVYDAVVTDQLVPFYI
jgi:carbamoylphosphate synthase large subunit